MVCWSSVRLIKSFQQIATDTFWNFIGLGEGLAEDDYADRDTWFTFDKKPADKVDIDDSVILHTVSSSSSTSSTTSNSSSTDLNTGNKMYQEDNKASTIEKMEESSPN
jgi:hypothetical protein